MIRPICSPLVRPIPLPLSLLKVGATPAYNADFLSGVLPAGLTYTNSSTTRTYFGADGLLKTAAANEAIFEYDPVTLALLGMRWEMEQRTNIFLHSGNFLNSVWQGIGLTKTGGQADSRGGTDAVLLTGPSLGILTQSVVASASGAHTCRIVAKGVPGTVSSTFLIRNNATATNDVIATVNPITGAIISGAGWTSRAVGNGFFEYKFTTTIPITAGDTLAFYYGDTSLVPSGWNLIVDYAQLEAGASASSYIPTTTAAVTRQPDVLTASSISWYRQDEGTVLFEGIASVTDAADRGLYAFTDGTTANRILAGKSAANSSLQLVIAASVFGLNQQLGTITSGVVFRSALAYKLNDSNSAANGVVGTTDTTVSIPAINQLRFGTTIYAGVEAFMGYVRRFQYFNTRLPNAQIQGMSRV